MGTNTILILMMMARVMMLMLMITRLTYNCAHLRSTKESLADSVKNLFVRKKICVKIFLGENLLGEHFLSEHFFFG